MYANPQGMMSKQSKNLLTFADLALQVLDDVIMTRWRVLPREQCLGNIIFSPGFSRNTLIDLCSRHSELHCQFHHRELKVGGESEG